MKHTRNIFKNGEHLTCGIYFPKVKDGKQPDCYPFCIDCGWNKGSTDAKEMVELTKHL